MFAQVAGFCGKGESLKALTLKEFRHLTGQFLVCVPGGQHFFHVHKVGNLCHAGKKDAAFVAVDPGGAFLKGAYRRGTGPGGAVALALLFADGTHPLPHLDFSSIQHAVFVNGILGYKFFKTICV